MRLIPLIFAALAVAGDNASAGETRETRSENTGPISILCDGAADDRPAIQAALEDATRKIVFPKDAACVIEAPITIPAGLDVDFNGTVIRRTTSDTTDNFQVQVQSGSIIRNLTLEVPAGVTILRGINLSDGSRAYDVKVTAVSQQNNLGSSERAAFNVHGDDTVVDQLAVENFDKAIRFESSSRGRWSNIAVSSYATGITLENSRRFTLSNYVARTASPNATTAAGHDGLVMENPYHGKVSNIDIRDSGEHCIYFSVGPGGSRYMSFTRVHLSNCGQSGFKLSGGVSGRAEYVDINGLEVVDCSRGNAAGRTEHALMIEYADYVAVSGFSTFREQDADHALHGIYFREATNVFIDSPYIQGVANSAIHFADEGNAETIENILIGSPQIGLRGADAVTVEVDTANSRLRNIVIQGAGIDPRGPERP